MERAEDTGISKAVDNDEYRPLTKSRVDCSGKEGPAGSLVYTWLYHQSPRPAKTATLTASGDSPEKQPFRAGPGYPHNQRPNTNSSEILLLENKQLLNDTQRDCSRWVLFDTQGSAAPPASGLGPALEGDY